MSARWRRVLIPAVALATLPSTVHAQDESWPRVVEAPRDYTIALYQPQPETLEGNLLTGRGAMSITPPGAEPIFGAYWFTTRIESDNDAREATLSELSITRVRWPESTEEQQARFTEIVEAAFPGEMVIDLDRLSASLATAEREQRSLDGLKHDPPHIVVTEELAVLLPYDGEPQTRPIPDTELERVVNTSFAVVRDTRSGNYYLSGGKVWYRAEDPLGPWTPDASPPAEIVRIVPEDTSSVPGPPSPPAIVTATEPTELIVMDGEPRWTPLGGGDLLYVENTENPILRTVEPANVYLLLSGRWYRGPGLDGPWSWVHPDSLPGSFEEIPPDSPVGGVRVSVAGTEEAEDAMLDAQIPQTAAIKRSATLDVEYDGEPKFEAIDGTDVAYATNTASQVLRIDGRYYAVDQGAWFVAEEATGPWVVADSVPSDKIKEIPPSSPVYNTTYVEVYDSTPEVVYVGYYPGYTWSFPYYGVPVYGTGWYYPPYWGPGGYYPRYPTWGFHVSYNPWYGWSFGMSWSFGFMNVGISFGGGYGGWGGYPGGGWYGGGYRGPVFINNGDINIGNSVGRGDRPRPGTHERPRVSNNMYNRPENRARVADRAGQRPSAGQLPSAGQRPSVGQQPAGGARPGVGTNDVFADRDGNVHRRDDSGWQSRQGGSWQPSVSDRGGAQRPTATPSTLNRDYQARQRGASRAASSPVRRGGGGRRR